MTDLLLFAPSGPLVTINGPDGKPMVTIERDRTLTYGEGYDPDEAARIFWAALARHAPVPV